MDGVCIFSDSPSQTTFEWPLESAPVTTRRNVCAALLTAAGAFAMRASDIGIDPYGFEETRDTVIGADGCGELDHLTLIELLLDRGKHVVGYLDLARHGIGIGQHHALDRVELGRLLPVFQRVHLCLPHAVAQRIRDMAFIF